MNLGNDPESFRSFGLRNNKVLSQSSSDDDRVLSELSSKCKKKRSCLINERQVILNFRN